MTLLFAASVSVFAAGDGLTYKVTGEDTACVSNAYEVRSNYVVADKITSEGKEYTVNEIKWIECRNVKSIVVPETVTILGNEALGYYYYTIFEISSYQISTVIRRNYCAYTIIFCSSKRCRPFYFITTIIFY